MKEERERLVNWVANNEGGARQSEESKMVEGARRNDETKVERTGSVPEGGPTKVKRVDGIIREELDKLGYRMSDEDRNKREQVRERSRVSKKQSSNALPGSEKKRVTRIRFKRGSAKNKLSEIGPGRGSDP